MADGRLEIEFGADTTPLKDDLQSGAASAKASFDGIRLSAVDFSAALRAAGNDLRRVKLDFDNAGAAASTAGANMAAAGTQAQTGGNQAASAASAAEGAHGRLRLATAGVTREFIVLGHEALTGNFSRVPGSILVLTERMGGLNLSMLGAVGAVAAVGFGLFELAKSAAEAATALRAVQAASEFHGVGLAGQQIADFVDQVKKLPGATTESAGEVVASFARMHNATAPLIQAMVDLVGQYATASGEKLPGAAKELANVFSDPIKNGDAFLHKIDASRDAINRFDQVAGKGDIAGALTVMMTALAEKTNRVEAATHEATQAERDFLTITSALVGAETGATEGAERLSKALSTIDTARIAKVAQDVAAASKATADRAGPTASPLDKVREQAAALKDDTSKTNAEVLAAEVKLWQDRIDVGDLYGKELTAAQTALNNARAGQQRAAGQEAIAQAREHISEMQAEGTRSRTQLLTAETGVWQRLLSGDKLTADQRTEVQRTLNATLAQLHGTEREQHLKALEAVTDGARRGSAARVAAAEQEVKFASATYGAGSDQAIAAEKRLTQAKRDEVDLRNQIAREEANTAIQIRRIDLDDAKSAADFRVRLHQISTDEKAALDRKYLDAKHALDLKALDDELRLGDQSAQNIARINNQKLVLQARYNADLHRLNQQAALDAARSWESTLQPIQRAFDTTIQGMILGTNRLRISTAQILGGIVLEYASAQLKIEVEWGAHQLAMAVGAQKWANASLLSWVGAQLGIASATDESTTNTVADQTAGAVASKAIAIDQGFSQIQIDAAVAAAGAMAAISAIPVVGPGLAPEVAAETYATTLGFASGLGAASAEGGMWTVPGEILSVLHPKESVIPAHVANPMRNFFEGGAPSVAPFSPTINFYANGRITKAELKEHADTLVGILKRAHRDGAFASARP